MKALSFLGVRQYQPATYVWRERGQEKSFNSNLFPEAIVHIFKPTELFVLVTSEAKEKNFYTLRERLNGLVSLYPIDIPDGKSEEELWEIFEKCSEVVHEKDELLLDITHAFRSLPLMVFSAAVFLIRIKKASIRHIVYGAFEAKDIQGRAPIFDLTPLLGLIDWLSGVEAFLTRSDAELMAQKMKDIQSQVWKTSKAKELPKLLQTVGNLFNSLALALHLSRPLDVMKTANDLLPKIEEAREEISQWAKPLVLIVDQIHQEISRLAHAKPEKLDLENLEKQLNLIEYYLNKKLIVQAITLAREWIVSWKLLQNGNANFWLNKNYRIEVEKELGKRIRDKRSERESTKLEKDLEAWTHLVELRDDVAHCGMRDQPISAGDIEQQAKKIPHLLRSLLGNT